MAQNGSLLGQQIGRYKILERVGQGGTAHVYKARHVKTNRLVALKTLNLDKSDDPGVLKRFRREVRALQKLDHPHIVKYYDFLDVRAGTFLVMEFIEGTTLQERLSNARRRGRRLPVRTIVSVIQQAAAALDYAHAQGMIHRDVKPANILLDENGDVHLTDFGLVLFRGSSQQTTTGAILGTPQYMAPEQAMSSRSATPQTDVYSLGICVYEMLTNTIPFSGDMPINVVLQHIQDTVPPPRKVDKRIPVKVERVVMKALKKEPQDRYATPGDFAAALGEVLRLPEKSTAAPRRKSAARKPSGARAAARARTKTGSRSAPAREKGSRSASRPAGQQTPGRIGWRLLLGLAALLLLLGAAGLWLSRAGGPEGLRARVETALSGPAGAGGELPPPTVPAEVDFRLATVRLLSPNEVDCNNQVPVFHLRAMDLAGRPLDNIRLDVFWNEGRVPDLNSGWNAPGYVKATLSRGTFQARVLGDVPPFGDRRYSSEVTAPLSTVDPPRELLEAAGYCPGGRCRQCATYSYEVIFQRQW